jgi:phage gp36-like protein
MSYASIADFTLAFGEQETLMLSELDEPNSVSIENSVVQRALDDATAEIESYLTAARIFVTGDPPLILRNKCCDIARYRLDKNRQREDVRLRYEDAIKFFKDVVKGDASIGLTPGTDQPAIIRNSKPKGFHGDRIFTYDSLSLY